MLKVHYNFHLSPILKSKTTLSVNINVKFVKTRFDIFNYIISTHSLWFAFENRNKATSQTFLGDKCNK